MNKINRACECYFLPLGACECLHSEIIRPYSCLKCRPDCDGSMSHCVSVSTDAVGWT
jgi:hypothetical protein